MKLYLRIWLAIVLTIAVFASIAGLLVRNHTEHVRDQMREQFREQPQGTFSELDIRDHNGKVVGRAKPPIRRSMRELDAVLDGTRTDALAPKRAYVITMNDGQQLELVLPPRPPRLMRPPQPWYFSSWGFVFAMSLIALAVALGSYPIVRRLTRRLEHLQKGVEEWGAGRLSTRVSVDGNDEVGFLAQKFNHAATQIEALLASHKSLLANASHELRSPLARIRMAIALVEGRASTPASQESLTEIHRNIQELDDLIEEILLASRLDNLDLSVGDRESFDLLGLAAEECARVKADLQVADDAVGLFEMVGYPKLMRRLLRNLLENATRHNNPSKGLVSMTLKHSGQELVVSVADHGAGVLEAECERIFAPFYRTNNTSEQGGGVGLGLALVNSIALRHDGLAKCIPTMGHGGLFVVKLPVGV